MTTIQQSEFSTYIPDKYKQMGYWLCRAPANPKFINLILNGSAINSFMGFTFTPENVEQAINDHISKISNMNLPEMNKVICPRCQGKMSGNKCMECGYLNGTYSAES